MTGLQKLSRGLRDASRTGRRASGLIGPTLVAEQGLPVEWGFLSMAYIYTTASKP